MKKISLSLKAVIFDMDGVITNTMPYHYRAWKKVFERRGHHVTHLDIYKREGQKGIQSVKEICREHGWPFNPGDARRILNEKERLFKKMVKPRFITGSRSFLRVLHRKGIRLALVTGTARQELNRILPMHLIEMFDVIITGTDVRNGKPHPEPYRKAVRRLGIDLRDAVAVENAAFGIRSAKAAGLRCFALETSLPREYLSEADEIFTSFKEMQRRVIFCRKPKSVE